VLADIGLDRKRWRQLMAVSHPDRHNGSPTAVEVAAWLNEIRRHIEEQS
jgi:hypothetical protein